MPIIFAKLNVNARRFTIVLFYFFTYENKLKESCYMVWCFSIIFLGIFMQCWRCWRFSNSSEINSGFFSHFFVILIANAPCSLYNEQFIARHKSRAVDYWRHIEGPMHIIRKYGTDISNMFWQSMYKFHWITGVSMILFLKIIVKLTIIMGKIARYDLIEMIRVRTLAALNISRNT